VPVGRLGHPSEVADLATAILANAYLTNQVISLDGGINRDRYWAVSIAASGPSWLGLPPMTRSPVIHDRCHHQDDDRYAAEARVLGVGWLHIKYRDGRPLA
jgi:hypothetical protein